MVSVKIQPGMKGQNQTMICEHNVAGQVDKFSTPSMISLMERASIEAIHEHLAEGQTSVGFEVADIFKSKARRTVARRAESNDWLEDYITG